MIGNPEQLGKSTGSDTDKNTFVQLYGIEKCDSLVKEHTAIAVDALSEFNDTEYICQLAQMLTCRIK